MPGPVDSERRLNGPDGFLLEGRGATLTDYIVEAGEAKETKGGGLFVVERVVDEEGREPSETSMAVEV